MPKASHIEYIQVNLEFILNKSEINKLLRLAKWKGEALHPTACSSELRKKLTDISEWLIEGFLNSPIEDIIDWHAATFSKEPTPSKADEKAAREDLDPNEGIEEFRESITPGPEDFPEDDTGLGCDGSDDPFDPQNQVGEPEPEEEASPKKAKKNTFKPKVKLTFEQMERFELMLRATWVAIASDCEEHIPKTKARGRVAHIIELICDANRPMDYGGMSKEEYEALSLAYHRKDTQKWLRKICASY